MPKKHVLLETAAFLDSGHVPSGVDRADAKVVAERFLSACDERLGKAPKDLDGHDAQALLVEVLPAYFDGGDPLAELVPEVLRGFLDHLEESALVAQSFELRHGLEGSFDAFLQRVRSGSGRRTAAPRQETIEHRADKLGRNDPCFCGSGKKFKKCCGRAG